MNEHEAAFVRDFIRAECQGLFLAAAASNSEAGHQYFIGRMKHDLMTDLDPRFIRERLEFDGDIRLARRLRCRLIASEKEHDGREVTVAEAFEILCDTPSGMIVSFIPAKLSCYKAPASPYITWLLRDDRRGGLAAESAAAKTN